MIGLVLFIFAFFATILILLIVGLRFIFKRSPRLFVIVICTIVLITSYIMPIGATCWTLICIALFTASLITGFKAIKHKNRAAYITAIRFFIAFALCGSYTLMKTGVKLFGISANTFTQDEGEEIYTRMLGKPASCVTILAAEGAYIPIADDDESIHFKTCPAEVRRTLGNNTYYVTTVAKSDFRSDIDGDSVFYAKGDSILELYRSTGTVSGVQIYLAMDSTEMFYREAW